MRSRIAKSLSALFISLDPTKQKIKMVADAHGAYIPPEHIDLDVLKGSKANQRRFLKLAPAMIECWESIEPTPTTKEMLRVLNRTCSIITKRLKRDEEVQISRTCTREGDIQESLQ